MENRMYGDPRFQRELVGYIAPREPGHRGGHYDYGQEERLGPTARMLAAARSSPENTNFNMRRGLNVRGLYFPETGRQVVAPNSYQLAFPNLMTGRGDLNSIPESSTASHEMLHRLQDTLQYEIPQEQLSRLDSLLESVGRSGLSNRSALQMRDSGSSVVELLPHAIGSGFSRTPDSLLASFGIDRERLFEMEDGEPRWSRIQREAAQIVEDVYKRGAGSAQYEQASRRLSPNDTGRGRAAYR